MNWINSEWIAFFKKRAIDAVVEAIDAAEPIKLFAGISFAPDMTKNRRANETVTDSTLIVLRAEDLNGNVKGIIINYACHCTVLDAGNYLISADYPGFLYKKFREEYPNSITVFYNGACGNLNIGYSADASALGINMGDMRTYKNAEHKADYLTKCAKKAMKEEKELDGSLSYRRIELKMPLKNNLPTKEQLKKSIASYDKKISMCSDEKEKQQLQTLRIYNISLLRNIKNYVTNDKPYILAETVLFKLGDLVFITIPGELFCEIGMEIKEVFEDIYRPVIIGYANGYFGYIPTKAALIAGGYECETSIHSLSTEQYLIDKMKKVKEMFCEN